MDKMLSGDAYGGAFRAHILVHAALVIMILKEVILSAEDRSTLEPTLQDTDSIYTDCR